MSKRPIWVSKDEAEVVLSTLASIVLREPHMTGFTLETMTAVVDRLLVITQDLPDNDTEGSD